MTIVVVDTETTGFGHVGKPPRDDAIISVGLAWRNDKGKLCVWESRCNPGDNYIQSADAKALEVNGFTRESLAYYPKAESVSLEIWDMLDSIGVSRLTSYNVAFDRPFLEKRPWDIHGLIWDECIMERATPICSECAGNGCWTCFKSGKGRWPKLKVACEQRGINTDGPLHSSGHDAKLAYLLMEALNNGR